MLNQWFGMGRLTKNPEMRSTQSGKHVTSFTIAVDRDFKSGETDFVSCVAWDKKAEFISSYFHKGSMIVVSGPLQSRSWTDNDDKKRVAWEVIVNNAYFGENKAKSDNQQGFEDLTDDGDLPF